jgi:hypothetical protein
MGRLNNPPSANFFMYPLFSLKREEANPARTMTATKPKIWRANVVFI